jgi:modification methylase
MPTSYTARGDDKPKFQRDVIHGCDCSNMDEIPDDAVDLIISGPPYWTLIDYHAFANSEPHLWQQDDSYEKYLQSLETWHSECFRVLAPGRYCVVNLATIEREGKTYPIPFHSVGILEGLGFDFRFEIVWHKVSGGRPRARNFIKKPLPGRFTPNIRTEYLLVFQKKPEKPFRSGLTRELIDLYKIDIDDFFVREIANNVWHIPPEYKKKDNPHPCPFPEEIPLRLIELFSLPRETVLDPFMGTGTTAKAAKSLDRHFVGYEIEEKFREYAYASLDKRKAHRHGIVCKYEKSQRPYTQLNEFSRGDI